MMLGTSGTFRLKARHARSERAVSSHAPRSSRRKEAHTLFYDFQMEPPHVGCYGAKLQAFSRVDLMVMVAVLALLSAWFVFTHSGERGRIVQCTHNLKVLGEAMFSYANDHGGSLPPVVIEEPLATWDIQLLPYLPQAGQSQLAAAKSPGAKKQLEWSGTQKRSNWFKTSNETLLVCPSDPTAQSDARSYAMPGHNMYDWPPGPNNWTGVGLVWTKANMARLLDNPTNQSLDKGQLDSLAMVKLSWLPDPANTMMLTELINPHNNIGRLGRSWVMNAYIQRTDSLCDAPSFHFGKFNYLMTDGHVSLLAKGQTDGTDGISPNIWTINAKD